MWSVVTAYMLVHPQILEIIFASFEVNDAYHINYNTEYFSNYSRKCMSSEVGGLGLNHRK